MDDSQSTYTAVYEAQEAIWKALHNLIQVKEENYRMRGVPYGPARRHATIDAKNFLSEVIENM